MSVYLSVDEELFLEDEREDVEDFAVEDVDEGHFGEDEDLVERRRRSRSRRPQRVRPGRTPQGRGYAPRGGAAVAAPGRYVTEAVLASKLEAVSARIGRDVRGLSDNIKRVAAQINTTNSQLAAVNKRQDDEIEKLSKRVKGLGQTDRRTADSSMMLALLPMLIKAKPPTIGLAAGRTGKEPVTLAEHVVQNVAVVPPQEDKLSTLLPLMLVMGMGTGGGGEQGGGMNNMMMPLMVMAMAS
jgi:hypothetical protein